MKFPWLLKISTITGQIGPRRGQDEPKRAIKSFKDQKSYIFKKWFSHRTVGIFSLLRPPKRASRGPRRLPRGTQRAPKPQKKGIQKGTQKLAIFGPILGPFWGPFWDPKLLQKGTKNGTTFGTPRCRLSGVRMTPNQELNASGEKATGAGIILSKRKGRDIHEFSV